MPARTHLPTRHTPPTVGQQVARRLTSRRGARLVLGIAVLLTVGLIGALNGSTPPGAASSPPDGSQSARVAELAQQFPDAGQAPVLAVFTREDGQRLTEADLQAVRSVGADLGELVGHDTAGPTTAEDGEAATVAVPVSTDPDDGDLTETIESLRTTATGATPSDLQVQITGGPAFGADIAAAFDGANVTLLAITISVVALLLLLTYRSPVLWLVPLTVVALADQVANVVTARMGEVWGLQFDAGIISVLVFGAGTNYALLLISRYREELRSSPDHRAALGSAWRAAVPAIVASNLTVVLSLLTLVFATMPDLRGLGVAAAAGLVIALFFALVVLPAALASCGRGVFWPFIPRPENERGSDGAWLRVARAVTRRPAAVAAVSLVVLTLFTTGLLGTRVGLSQAEQFRVDSEAATGFATLAEHFPPGEAAPLTVMARTDRADAVAAAASDVPGIVRATVTAQSDAGWSRITAIGSTEPETRAAHEEVRDLREAVADVDGAQAIVGGPNAESLDAKNAARTDLLRIAPLILGLVLLTLIILLRAVLAPVLLTAINLLSALAAIGLGTWVGTRLFDFPALDVSVPVLAFLFLVALGVDYTIFLVHRARQLTRTHTAADAITVAISRTGSVITSAGIVLAAVFATLGVLPLVVLGQLGLIVGLGVLVDTTVVRTLVVPAAFALIGDHVWWPQGPLPAGSATRGGE